MPDPAYLTAPEWPHGIDVDLPGIDDPPPTLHAVTADTRPGIAPTVCHQRVELPDNAQPWPPTHGNPCPRCAAAIEQASRRRW